MLWEFLTYSKSDVRCGLPFGCSSSGRTELNWGMLAGVHSELLSVKYHIFAVQSPVRTIKGDSSEGLGAKEKAVALGRTLDHI